MKTLKTLLAIALSISVFVGIFICKTVDIPDEKTPRFLTGSGALPCNMSE